MMSSITAESIQNWAVKKGYGRWPVPCGKKGWGSSSTSFQITWRWAKPTILGGWIDIDWDQPGLEGKILAPFLGEEPDEALARGTLRLLREEVGLAFAYYDHRFPLRPEDQHLAENLCTGADLEALLARQHFVLASWRQANARVNWRLFFDITDLAAIRIGEAAVFEAVHAKILALYAEGLIDGVRVDHVDGLADPRAYCRTLRARLDALRPGAALYVEKILADGESLAADWQADGTTGYDFLNEASAVLHQDDDGFLTALWKAESGRELSFEQEESLARRQMLAQTFQAQLTSTARAFVDLLDLGAEETRRLLTEVLVRLRCYRSYATGKSDSPGAGWFLSDALTRTRSDIPHLGEELTAFGDLFARRDGDPKVVDALRRFSQLSAPLAAKSVEDTAFYRYGRLLSRNDVGTHPGQEFLSVDGFHQRMMWRARQAPASMLTTATHDHKRGEDARARLAVLSHHPDRWRDFARQAPVESGVDPGDAYQLLQALFGAWPKFVGEEFAGRIQGWCRKFLREGKLRSNWSDPHEAYERRFCAYAASLITDVHHAAFRKRMTALLSSLDREIRIASIGQLVLRNTVPGVPDLYQGCECEDLTMVDPDNRRPVDFGAREGALHTRDKEKLTLLTRLLHARRQDPEFWAQSNYEGCTVSNCLAFRRSFQGRTVQVILSRFGSDAETVVKIDRFSTDILTGHRVPAGSAQLNSLFAAYPAAVLSSS